MRQICVLGALRTCASMHTPVQVPLPHTCTLRYCGIVSPYVFNSYLHSHAFAYTPMYAPHAHTHSRMSHTCNPLSRALAHPFCTLQYCVIVGPYPFNSFLAGFLSCIGTFVLTGMYLCVCCVRVHLRMLGVHVRVYLRQRVPIHRRVRQNRPTTLTFYHPLPAQCRPQWRCACDQQW